MATELPQLLGLVQMDYRSDWRYGPMANAHHTLLLFTRGRMQIDLNRQQFEVRSGQVVLYPSGMTYRERAIASDPPSAWVIQFHLAHLHPDLPLVCTDHSLRVRQLMDWVFEETGTSTDDTLAGRTTGMLLTILNQMQYHDRHQMPEMVRVIREYIRAHVDEQLTLDDLAQVAGLTRYHFNRRYKELAGITPMAELRNARLYKARYLLLHTDWTLREIAKSIGMKDEFHFSRAFKKQFGIAPNHYRQQQRVQEPADAT